MSDDKATESVRRRAHYEKGGQFEICRYHSGCPQTHYLGTLEHLFEDEYKSPFDQSVKTRAKCCGIYMTMDEYLAGECQKTAYWVSPA